MRTAEREGERAAYVLAAAYFGGSLTPSSLSPARTTGSSRAGCGTSRRPMSARSTKSRPMALGRSALGGRASSARSRRGWAWEGGEKCSFDLDFRKRREDTARRRMMPTNGARGRAGGTAVNDLEALGDENQHLKVALNRAIEENKRYRVNKMRLEGELLRADGKIEVLLAELEQSPGNRDQRLISAARREVETCAVVRMLASQKGHLQHLLALQERELETIKRTKEWSAVMEMTAATEEYFVEIQRLQRLLASQQQEQKIAAECSVVGPPSGDYDEERGAAREEYSPKRRDQARRRNSGVDDTIWIRRPEPPDESLSISSPVHGGQDIQRVLDVETIAMAGAGEAYRNRYDGNRSPTALQADGFFTAVENRGDNDLPPQEWGVSVGREVRRRPASPKRTVSPPHRAQMATRAGQKAFDNDDHVRSPADPRSSRRVAQQVPREEFGRQQKRDSRSQASVRAASVRARACDADARTAAVRLNGRRPVSAPRRKMGMETKNVGNARRAESLSSFGKGRQQEAPSCRAASGRGGAWVVQQRTMRASSSPSRTRDYSIRADPVRTAPVPNKPSSSRKKRGRKGSDFGDGDGHDGGNDASLSTVAVARSPQKVDDNFEGSAGDVDNGSRDSDVKYRLSSSAPSRKLLAAASNDATFSVPVAKEFIEGFVAQTEGPRQEQATNEDSISDPSGSGDPGGVTIKDTESMTAEGDQSGRKLAGSDASPRAALDVEVDWSSDNKIDGAQKMEDRSAMLISTGNSFDDVDAHETHAELMADENNTTSNSITDNVREDEQMSAEKTDGGDTTTTEDPRQEQPTNNCGIGHSPGSGGSDSVTLEDNEIMAAEGNGLDGNLPGYDASSRAALGTEIDWSPHNVTDGAQCAEGGNERLISTGNRFDGAGSHEIRVDSMTGEESTTSKGVIADDTGDGQTPAENTDRLPPDASNSARNISKGDDDDNHCEDSTIRNDYSSHGGTEESHQREAAVEVEVDNLLFDGDGKGVGDENSDGGGEPLDGENSAAPSEYGDDFDDDFEDEDE